MTNKSGKKSTKKSAKKFNFSLGWSGLLSAALFFFLAVIWAFILGIVVGRGYHPDNVVSQMGKLLPGHKAEEQQQKNGQDDVLKPEELGFYDNLEQGEQKGARKEKTGETPAKPPQKEVATRISPAPEKTKQDKPARETSRASGAKKYLYVYQVGSFQSVDKASQLCSRLKAAGIKSYIKEANISGTKWHRVHIPFKGSAKETKTLQTKLQDLGLNKFFIRSKEELNG